MNALFETLVTILSGWQAFEKTLGRPSVAAFAPRRFSLVLPQAEA